MCIIHIIRTLFVLHFIKLLQLKVLHNKARTFEKEKEIEQ